VRIIRLNEWLENYWEFDDDDFEFDEDEEDDMDEHEKVFRMNYH